MIPALFIVLGAAAGGAHAWLIAISLRAAPRKLSLPARLALIAVVLVLAAIAGSLIWAMGGWAAGFLIATRAALRTLR